MESAYLLSQRLHNFSLPGCGWTTRHARSTPRYLPLEDLKQATALPLEPLSQKEIEDDLETMARVKRAKKRKFTVALNDEEIEKDFVAITGKKPPKKPRKRPKKLQQQLDLLFPGSALSFTLITS